MSTNSANLASNLADQSSHLVQTGLDPHRYDDILYLDRPVSKEHPPMSLTNRAAQFAPFAALTGYHETVKSVEAGSKDEPKIEYFDDETT